MFHFPLPAGRFTGKEERLLLEGRQLETQMRHSSFTWGSNKGRASGKGKSTVSSENSRAQKRTSTRQQLFCSKRGKPRRKLALKWPTVAQLAHQHLIPTCSLQNLDVPRNRTLR
jgi:hypothetical protein